MSLERDRSILTIKFRYYCLMIVPFNPEQFVHLKRWTPPSNPIVMKNEIKDRVRYSEGLLGYKIISFNFILYK